MNFFRQLFIRDLESGPLIEAFLASAVSSILLIRFYLHLTDYPKVASNGLHIAHMLWGGLLMLISIVMMLLFLNRNKYFLPAILGGIGFGTFLDELGKFLTQDNNYFFKPTISIIYVIFILIYLIIHSLEKFIEPTNQEYLANAIEIEKQASFSPITKDQLSKVKQYLSLANPPQLYSRNINEILSSTSIVKPSFLNKTFDKVNSLYRKLTKKRVFKWTIITFFLIQALYFVFHSAANTELITDYLFSNSLPQEDITKSFIQFGNVLFSSISGLFVLIGVFRLFKSRQTGYQMFKIATLITLFLTQFFDFYTSQFNALYGFFINLAVLITLNFMINSEKTLSQPPIETLP